MSKGKRIVALIDPNNIGLYERALEKGEPPRDTYILSGLNDKGFLKTIHADAYTEIPDDTDPVYIAREGQAYVTLNNTTLISEPSGGQFRELTDAARIFVAKYSDQLGATGKTEQAVAEGYAQQATLPIERRPQNSVVRPLH